MMFCKHSYLKENIQTHKKHCSSQYNHFRFCNIRNETKEQIDVFETKRIPLLSKHKYSYV